MGACYTLFRNKNQSEMANKDKLQKIIDEEIKESNTN